MLLKDLRENEKDNSLNPNTPHQFLLLRSFSLPAWHSPPPTHTHTHTHTHIPLSSIPHVWLWGLLALHLLHIVILKCEVYDTLGFKLMDLLRFGSSQLCHLANNSRESSLSLLSSACSPVLLWTAWLMESGAAWRAWGPLFHLFCLASALAWNCSH